MSIGNELIEKDSTTSRFDKIKCEDIVSTDTPMFSHQSKRNFPFLQQSNQIRSGDIQKIRRFLRGHFLVVFRSTGPFDGFDMPVSDEVTNHRSAPGARFWLAMARDTR